jgi:simple sugar transport system ATP-binding protein
MGPHHDAIALVGIEKSFGPVNALRGVDWEVSRGEVHALLGENGAGKSTLCSILAGAYRPDAGQIRVDGVERTFASPRDGLGAGIGMVYQEFRLVRSLTVAQNLALASPHTEFVIKPRRLESEARELAEPFGLQVDPAARVGDLSMGEQQRVEIL